MKVKLIKECQSQNNYFVSNEVVSKEAINYFKKRLKDIYKKYKGFYIDKEKLREELFK